MEHPKLVYFYWYLWQGMNLCGNYYIQDSYMILCWDLSPLRQFHWSPGWFIQFGWALTWNAHGLLLQWPGSQDDKLAIGQPNCCHMSCMSMGFCSMLLSHLHTLSFAAGNGGCFYRPVYGILWSFYFIDCIQISDFGLKLHHILTSPIAVVDISGSLDCDTCFNYKM